MNAGLAFWSVFCLLFCCNVSKQPRVPILREPGCAFLVLKDCTLSDCEPKQFTPPFAVFGHMFYDSKNKGNGSTALPMMFHF